MGDITLEEIEESAKEGTGDVMPKAVKLFEDSLLAALSTIHCWQLELKPCAVLDPLTPLPVSLSHSQLWGDNGTSP